MPSTPLITVEPEIHGKASSEKVKDLRQLMFKKEVKWLVITALDEVACKC